MCSLGSPRVRLLHQMVPSFGPGQTLADVLKALEPFSSTVGIPP